MEERTLLSAKRRGQASFGVQLKALLWKNWLLKSRSWKGSILEVLIPVLIIVLLMGIKGAVTIKQLPDEIHNNFALSLRPAFFDNLSTHMRSSSQRFALFPDNPEVRKFGDFLTLRHPSMAPLIKYFPDAATFVQAVTSANYGSPVNPAVQVGVHFDSLITPHYSFEIHLNASGSAPAQRGDLRTIRTATAGPGLVTQRQIVFNKNEMTTHMVWGFSEIQNFVSNYIIHLESQRPIEEVMDDSFTVLPFPTPAHLEDAFASYVSAFLGFLVTLGFIWPVTRIVRAFVEEKETRVRETMMMMGLKPATVWISWFLTYALIMFVLALLITIVSSGSLYKYSNKFLIFIFFWFFGLSVISFCFLVSSIFSRARMASLVGVMLFFGLIFPTFALSGDDVSAGAKRGGCLSPLVAMGLGMATAAQLESTQTGVTFASAQTEVSNITFATSILMLLLDIVLYLGLGLYLEQVLPHEYGIQRKPWFCFTPAFWKGPSQQDASAAEELGAQKPSKEQSENIQEVDDALAARALIKVRNLRREFASAKGDAPNVAVDNVHLDIYEGQILSLLGHNGAGKTTTINMLTGLFPASTGDALVDGMRITTQMDEIRKVLGICPQDNRLFDNLTVREHLELYGSIKGVPKSELDAEVKQIIAQVGLTEKAKTWTMSLSGGMKRKLSLGMALIGGSRIVFLDEPTSGMDPYSRRSTWDTIKKVKQDRVIILTTHFMDEADYLGDRIAIMHQGQVKCCGSSLYLKSKYGVGYTMTLSKSAKFDLAAVRAVVDGCVLAAGLHDARGRPMDQADILTNVAAEITFRLPFEASKHFPGLFDQLDSQLGTLGVANYGISVTTLEEVFLRVGKGEEVDPKARLSVHDLLDAAAAVGSDGPSLKIGGESEEQADRRLASLDDVPRPVGWEKFKRHLYALLFKRWHTQKRNKKAWLWTVGYPFLIMVGGMALLRASQNVTMSPGLLMAPDFVGLTLPAPFLCNQPAFEFLSTLESDSTRVVAVSGVESAQGMAEYLLRSFPSADKPRFGALLLLPTTPPNATANATGSDTLPRPLSRRPILFVNTTSLFAVPTFMNLYHNAKLRSFTGSGDAVTIQVSSKPFPPGAVLKRYMSSSIAMVLAVAFALIPASYASHLVIERETSVKHQQLISGVSAWAYWVSTLIWDVANYVPPAILSLVVIAVFGVEDLVTRLGPYLLNCLLYGLSVTCFTYMLHFLFSTHSSAQNAMLFLNLISGLGLLIANIFLDLLESTRDTNASLKYLYRLLPPFCFAESVSNLIIKTADTGFSKKLDDWDMDVVGTPFVYMTVEAVAFFAATMLIEKILATPALLSRVLRLSRPAPKLDFDLSQEDDDVRAERQRVLAEQENSKDMIRLVNMSKVYPSRGSDKVKVAVKDLSFGISQGECFGFLGINGAGKSTTLKMLTADTLPSNGTAFLKGLDLMSEQERVRIHIGYCPQFDALIPTMTAKETLALYARIKGVPEVTVGPFVDQMVRKLGLSKFADEPCGGYSGGNKRKLSVGMALIGNPSIVFLDEPSTGMDPESRRFMWQVIASTMKNRSVILTTHSMEECEALCGRIGIIVGGAMRCIGSSQHLKSKYGDGYQLDLHVLASKRPAATGASSEGSNHGTHNLAVDMNSNLPDNNSAHGGGSSAHGGESNLGAGGNTRHFFASQEEAVSNLKQWVERDLPGATLMESQSGHLKFRIPKQMALGKLFGVVEERRAELNVQEYSISETTLEQIFIFFAGQQEEEQGGAPGVQ